MRTDLKTEESASFFAKKEAKKLLFSVGCGADHANARRKQKFFASFFQKRSSCLLLSSANRTIRFLMT
jgi:hypothetical protein